MDIHRIITLSKAFMALGWSVQDQLVESLESDTDANPAALREGRKWLEEVRRAAGKIDDALFVEANDAIDRIDERIKALEAPAPKQSKKRAAFEYMRDVRNAQRAKVEASDDE